MGEGEEIVGIAGHLDIVPVGGDWTYDPFKLTRDGDHVYGRGTTDDKGPVIEALLCDETSKGFRCETEQKSPSDHGMQ
ncbi:MAG: M20/M25/M40 family metallo-hydrolase [Ruminococcus sp.]